MDEQEIRQALGTSVLFRDCELTIAHCVHRHHRKGAFLTDTIGERVMIGLVISGGVDVYSVALDGSEIQLSNLEPGDVFGICNLLAPQALHTVLKCRMHTEVLYIAKDDYIASLSTHPEACLQYAAVCNEKIQFLIRRIELLTIQSCRGKLLEYLLHHMDDQHRVVIPSSKEQFAKRLGIGRASLFRELALLEQEQLISVCGPIIQVSNGSALTKKLYAQC